MHRQVKEYTERFYLPSHSRFSALMANGAERACAIAGWIEKVRSTWRAVSIEEITGPGDELSVGVRIHATARLQLAGLPPDDVVVQLVMGRVNRQGEMAETVLYTMSPLRQTGGVWTFEVNAPCCPKSGLHGYTVRVLPSHPDLGFGSLPGLITWANGSAASGASA
jgi:starch phosphorylase